MPDEQSAFEENSYFQELDGVDDRKGGIISEFQLLRSQIENI